MTTAQITILTQRLRFRATSRLPLLPGTGKRELADDVPFAEQSDPDALVHVEVGAVEMHRPLAALPPPIDSEREKRRTDHLCRAVAVPQPPRHLEDPSAEYPKQWSSAPSSQRMGCRPDRLWNLGKSLVGGARRSTHGMR